MLSDAHLGDIYRCSDQRKNDIAGRHLWVLQGEFTTLCSSISQIITRYPGDWLFISLRIDLQAYFPSDFSYPISKNSYLPTKTKSLLGQEYRHAIFDATEGFNLDAFSIVTGTLTQGSLLILLLPDHVALWRDNDSLRWCESDQPIYVPHFIQHLFATIADLQVPVFDLTKNPYPFIKLADQVIASTDHHPDLQEQQFTLNQILASNKSIIALIAKRGRGKSALAGLFTHYRNCIVTAPNKASLTTFFRFAKQSLTYNVPFFAPDELLLTHLTVQPDYLIIDEAAMIPLPLLEQLWQFSLKQGCGIFLTTTMDGYEGTGQGILLKFLHDKNVDLFYLDRPIRWHKGDKLEQFSDQLLVNTDQPDSVFCSLSKHQQYLSATDGDHCQQKISDDVSCRQIGDDFDYELVSRQHLNDVIPIYQLLKTSHYRTTPTDLRRLLDAPNMLIWQAKQNGQLLGSLAVIHEGNLEDDLIEQVWQGRRRPKGNLVAQALVAYAGEKLAAKLSSIRINRIAVKPLCRRHHIGQGLILHLVEYARQQHNDFVSVSFAYSDDVYLFWQSCGFTIVHITNHKEASSGRYSVMAIRPLSKPGEQLTQNLSKKLQRNWYWLQNKIELTLPIEIDMQQFFSRQDYAELRGFTDHYRSYEVSYAILCRLLWYFADDTAIQADAYPILTALIKQQQSESQVIQQYQLIGKQTLMKILKQEVVKLLDDFGFTDKVCSCSL
ncbi:GNAT family N-acetyltransferase [Orbaceae bacterium ESL0727]|nr:GNAT family N-acetyltransferase [Orbaceae bacterium ESL0727]